VHGFIFDGDFLAGGGGLSEQDLGRVAGLVVLDQVVVLAIDKVGIIAVTAR
jgi:hypothetical protein